MAKNKMKQTDINVKSESALHFKGDLLIVGLFKGTKTLTGQAAAVDRHIDGGIGNLIRLGDFTGNVGEIALLYAPASANIRRVMPVGLGEKDKFKMDFVRQAIGTAIRQADKLGGARVGLLLPETMGEDVKLEVLGQAVAEGAVLGRYDYEDYLSEPKNGHERVAWMQLTLLESDARSAAKLAAGCRVGAILAEGQNLTRSIANKPANEINPPALAREAQRIAHECGLKCRVFDPRQLAAMKMNAILAVGNGSASPPRLIMLEHNGRRGKDRTAPPDLVVVGKAVTFDSGGIDIKPAPKMELMKFDKSGGCAVLGILAAAARLKLPVRLIGLVPSAENLLSATCWRPGDIVTTRSGKTVEVLSTDAEGRMLLADALAYGSDFKPRAMVDLATLTGACAVALGEHYAGLFGNDEKLMSSLRQAGETSGDAVWPMPSGPDYLEQMKSKVADLKNVGAREGGACMAAAFLNEFTTGIPWVHLDIACVAKPDTDKPYRSNGATGFGVRLVLEYLRTLC